MKKHLLVIVLLLLSVVSAAQIKIACIGNSITYGAGIEGRDSLAYPQQLGRILGNEWQVLNFGHSGATLLKNGNMPYWNLPEFKSAKEFLPDVVIIILGTNDSKPMNWDIYKAQFKPDYEEMIKVFQNLESHPLTWLGIPIPVVEDTWDIRKKIVEQDITTLITSIAHEQGMGLIDFYTVLSLHPDLIPDHIHPNAEGATVMAKEAARILMDSKQKILNR